MAKHIIEEAKRCLQCKNPKCQKGCPINTSIPEVINLFLEGNISSAGEILFKNNPLSVICSLVCPQENQCEGNCILGVKSNPIQISTIENYISDYSLSIMDLKPEKKLKGNIGIIGSGPAGITIAFVLALKGYSITIFEAHDKIGGVLRYGIPEFRLPKDILERLKDQLLHLGVKIRPNTLIGPVLTIEDLFRDGFDALFIGTGVWKPGKITTKGIELNDYGLIITDKMGRTTREGVFASGDVVTGAKTVVEAVKFSKEVAEVIHEYVSRKYTK